MKHFGHSKAKVISTDTIIPLHRFDDVPIFRNIVNDFTLRFDDVLDAEKLRKALERLLQLGKWKKLGARLRMNVIMPRSQYLPIDPSWLIKDIVGFG
jgi:hypothetical protein